MSRPPEQLSQSSETTAEPSVGSVSTRVWTTSSNASAYSNSKKSRISNVFGNKKNKSRAVAYARVSSKRQAEEGVSLDAQVERLLAYAEFRGLELDPEDIYIDDGISRYQFHENRNMFESPEWWGTAEYHDSVKWVT